MRIATARSSSPSQGGVRTTAFSISRAAPVNSSLHCLLGVFGNVVSVIGEGLAHLDQALGHREALRGFATHGCRGRERCGRGAAGHARAAAILDGVHTAFLPLDGAL